jgi:hypothetical protein
MRLTVGPLSPSVYWRRRALVLGVLVLIVLGIVYAVGGGPSAGTGPHLSSTASGSPTAAPTGTDSPTPTAFTLPVSSVTGRSPTGTGSVMGSNCMDSEIQLTAASSPATVRVGEAVIFTLKVKNISGRTCNRNTGSIPQELRLVQGDVVVWSSDDCASGTPYDFEQPFTPDFEKVFDITWDGLRSRDESGAKTCAAPGTRPVGGAYELVARLGTLFSTPTPVTLRSGS